MPATFCLTGAGKAPFGLTLGVQSMRQAVSSVVEQLQREYDNLGVASLHRSHGCGPARNHRRQLLRIWGNRWWPTRLLLVLGVSPDPLHAVVVGSGCSEDLCSPPVGTSKTVLPQ